MRWLSLTFALALAGAAAAAQNSPGDAASIYLIDVEGGGATLFVSPSGESLLIDTGNGGDNASRDAGRIVAAMEDAGLSRIDYLITTHWHGDHFGGLAELADRVPIRTYVDHGPSVQPNENTDAFIEGAYRELYGRAERMIAVPGDRIPIDGLNVTVLASGGETSEVPVPGGGQPNPYCADFTPQAEDTGENAQSVGVLVRLGAFRALHLGDLTANKEFDLMCPANPIGTVDLFVVSHHGQPTSNMEVLVHAVAPRVAIMNNGTRKGGQPEAMRVIHSSPGLEDLWQLHFSLLSGQEYTVPGLFIANTVDAEAESMPLAPSAAQGRGGSPPPAHDGAAHWIKVSARSDGSFVVTNSRNGFSKAY